MIIGKFTAMMYGVGIYSEPPLESRKVDFTSVLCAPLSVCYAARPQVLFPNTVPC